VHEIGALVMVPSRHISHGRVSKTGYGRVMRSAQRPGNIQQGYGTASQAALLAEVMTSQSRQRLARCKGIRLGFELFIADPPNSFPPEFRLHKIGLGRSCQGKVWEKG
jgi:hypothetical protein